jgi:hypothetical protein
MLGGGGVDDITCQLGQVTIEQPFVVEMRGASIHGFPPR